jgi:hypothetical protein
VFRHSVLALVAFVALATPCAHAGTSQGLVTKTIAHTGDIIMFTAGPHSGQPACAGAGDWALSLSTPTGKAQYALLLVAYSLGKSVTVVGTNACTAWGTLETPAYITMEQ